MFMAIFSSFTAFASTGNVDITTSSVRDDLASMGEDKLTYLSDTTNIFIAMAQRYDSSNNLRTYVYMNYIGSTSDPLKISISTSTTDDKYNITEIYKDYELKFVNNNSTWVKYEVLDLPNLDFVTRRYNIKGITSGATKILSMNETYIFHGITNDSIEVLNQEVETITITEKEVRFFCYGEESKWYEFFGVDGALGNDKKYTDAWYIFFNTDKPMDDLREVEITYQPYDYHVQLHHFALKTTEFTEDFIKTSTDLVEEETILNYGNQETVVVYPGKTKVSSTTNWWGGYDTSYQELDNIMDLREYDSQSTEDNPFVFTEQAKKYTWGVNFLNTEKESLYEQLPVGMGVWLDTNIVDGTGVCNTAILRLKYETNGIVINAYAVDVPTDDFYGSDAEVNMTSYDEILDRIIAIILLLVLVYAVISIGAPAFNVIIKAVTKFVSFFIKLIVQILTIPLNIVTKRKRK